MDPIIFRDIKNTVNLQPFNNSFYLNNEYLLDSSIIGDC